MGARDLKIGTILDAAGWSIDALAATATPAGSPERRAKIVELSGAVQRGKVVAEAYDGKLAPEIRLALRVAEWGLGRLGAGAASASKTEPTAGPDRTPAAPAAGSTSGTKRPRRRVLARGPI